MTASDYNGFNISCFGGNNGSIDLTIAGGTPPYTILWSNDQVTEDIADLPAGYYRVTVDDADTLTMPVEAEITLTEPRRMDISYQAYQYPNGYNISVYGACNGSIDLSVTDGVPPYTYSWKDGPTTQDRIGICASTYRVTITDLNGCQASSESIFMKEPNRGDWQLDGNTSLDPNTQFIGTADSTDLVFRTNNQERFRIGSNGQLTLGGEIASFGGINFGDNKTIKYQPPGGGFPGIFSIGQDPSVDPFSISGCTSPVLNASLNYQFNGTIQLYGNSYAGNNLNIMELGFDGSNAIIDATGMSQDPVANRLLLNYYCGRDVVVGNSTSGNFTASRDAFINNKLGVNMGGATIQKQFEVNGDVRLLANASDENNGFEISKGLTPPVRRGISIGNDPDGSFNFWINSNQPNNSFNFIQYNEATSSNINLLKIMGNGDVAIGSLPEAGYKLTVCGNIKCTKIRVESPWCDFVFDSEYDLMSLKDVKQFICKYKHLPEMPTEKQIISEGLDLGEIIRLQMKKIEELYLYTIEQQERIEKLEMVILNNTK